MGQRGFAYLACTIMWLPSISATAHAQIASTADSAITAYPATFFAGLQPYSALDMITLLPGFKLELGDADVRGYAGASGNVLIDGQRPASKQESVEELLRRIPAASVERIELIRPGAAGFDMQGRAILANVVRRSEASTRGRIEAGLAVFKRGPVAPRLAAELTHRRGDTVLEASAAVYREIDDEHGYGTRNRNSPTGVPLRTAQYDQPEGKKIAEATAAYQLQVAGGKLRVNALVRSTREYANIDNIVSFPTPLSEVVLERSRVIDSEIGLHFDRRLGQRLEMELLALRRMSDEKSADTEPSGSDNAVTRQDDRGSETIFRGVLRRTGSKLSLEAGIEGALNILDSDRALIENGADIALPQAQVKVEEKRAEGFVTATWRFSPQWSLEAGSRAEVSRLTQSGDTSLAKSFFYPKPRALLSWAPGKNDQLRILIERSVGQLTFSNFLGTAALATGVITAGNPDLEPDKLWRYEIAFERHFWSSGSIVLTARREAISDVVDRVPVTGAAGTVFDAVGNIGTGQRDELGFDVILPFDRIGFKGLLLKANLIARHSRVTDPATGIRRRISGDAPIEGEAHLTYEAPAWKSRFGLDLNLPSETASFKFNEIQVDKVGTRLGIFAEYKPTPAWNIRIYAKNLTDSPATRERQLYGALRGSAPLSIVELRRLQRGPYAGITIQRTLGR